MKPVIRVLPYLLSAAAVAGGPTLAAEEPPATAVATFAGGCFWCMEPVFDALDGVLSTTSGYTGGTLPNPTYEEVSSGSTGHTEAIQVRYDPARVSYERLLEVYWRNIDPTVANRQFCDRGTQYRTAIFYHDEAQRLAAERSRAELERSGAIAVAIATRIVAAGDFYPAEDYHQDYYRKNPVRYQRYHDACGRDQRLEELWGPSAPP
ncbi:MAG: peptide-methionine (S)-S-oxide reductase [Holophagae bacterium]|nr:MAG: peptide-methionine (S)-S-oxide reductase [Holophagae bacterium]